MIEQSLVCVKAAVIFPGVAVATEAIPGMTVRVGLRMSDVKTVVFAQVLANVENFNFSLNFLAYGRETKHLMSFGIRAVFAVIHLHSVC